LEKGIKSDKKTLDFNKERKICHHYMFEIRAGGKDSKIQVF